jgi:hypothetical protein
MESIFALLIGLPILIIVLFVLLIFLIPLIAIIDIINSKFPGNDALLMALIEECRARGFKQMLAVIGDSDNHGSIGLHRACGFEHVGVLKNTGFKFERFLDTVLMQLDLTA